MTQSIAPVPPPAPPATEQKPPAGRRPNPAAPRPPRAGANQWRSIKRIAPWILIPLLLWWMFFSQSARDTFTVLGLLWESIHPVSRTIIGVTLGTAFQLAFAISFAILQFVAIFWFMSQTRVETIRPEDPKSVTFKDYWGQPNLVALVRQWIGLLADRRDFVKMGGKYINGILLYGPPGTGKTMLAKAMAGEAGIPFISIEGSGFRGMFWGVDVLRMVQFVGRAKKLAREYGACICYIDEIDAVGQSRGGVMGGRGGMGMGMGGMMGGGSGALTRLLYEMDGIEQPTFGDKIRARWHAFIGKEAPKKTWHVLFMGSTNRPEVLDAALLRPGRFDAKIQVDPPDRTGRREIVKGYLSRIKHKDVDVEAVVEDTPNATPAQIASAIGKDSVRIALSKGRDHVTQNDIDRAIDEQRYGLEQPIEEWDPVQRVQVAYHEAGHAVAQHYAMPDQRIVRVTIVRRGSALGFMHPVDRTEVHAMPIRRIVADVIVAMAGHVAVKLHMGEYWTGAYSDNEAIRGQIRHLYLLGYFGPPIGTWGDGAMPGWAERFWRVMEEQTETLLREHMPETEAIAQALLKQNTLTNPEVLALLHDNGWKAERFGDVPTAFPELLGRLIPPGLAAPMAVPQVAAPSTYVQLPPDETAMTASHAEVVAIASPTPSTKPTRMIKPPRPQDFAERQRQYQQAEGARASQPADPSPAHSDPDAPAT